MIKIMLSDKSPIPDGLSSAFYKFSWDVIKSNFIDALNHFYITKKLLQQWKATFLVMIPKVSNSSSPLIAGLLACLMIRIKFSLRFLSIG